MEFPVFQCLPIASCSVSKHYWEEPDSLFIPFHWVFVYTGNILLSLFSSGLNSPSSLKLSSEEMFQSLCDPRGPLLDSLQ